MLCSLHIFAALQAACFLRTHTKTPPWSTKRDEQSTSSIARRWSPEQPSPRVKLLDGLHGSTTEGRLPPLWSGGSWLCEARLLACPCVRTKACTPRGLPKRRHCRTSRCRCCLSLEASRLSTCDTLQPKPCQTSSKSLGGVVPSCCCCCCLHHPLLEKPVGPSTAT